MTADGGVEERLRDLAPQALGALLRRYGHFPEAEDAVQEALLAAALDWPRDGLPDRPLGWLITVASRRMTDILRSESARRERERRAVSLASRDPVPGPLPGPDALAAGPGTVAGARDDTLTLLFLCCHPALTPASQVALTLRAVGGLTTAEIARALLASEPATGRRITRAKQRLRGEAFAPPVPDDRDQRLAAVLRVLYVIFTEGSAATAGDALGRAALSAEAIRLTRQVGVLLPRDGEVTGLLALMLLTDARRAARTGQDGELVPLDRQDRTRWDRAAVAEGTALVERALGLGPAGVYTIQAAVAALHDEAPGPAETDWPQILGLYDVLVRRSPDPMARLGRAVAVGMAEGPAAGLAAVDAVEGDLPGHHRPPAVRAHLLERAGEHTAARDAYRLAASRARNGAERRYLLDRADRLAD